MIWPLSIFFGKSRQRKQIAESLERVVEVSTRQRDAARTENLEAATGAIQAVERRMKQGVPLRDLLEQVVQRQSDERLARNGPR